MLLGLLPRALVLVHHMGLGMSKLSWNPIQRLNEVVLIGELEHTSLGKIHQGHWWRAGTWSPFHIPYPVEPHLYNLDPQ